LRVDRPQAGYLSIILVHVGPIVESLREHIRQIKKGELEKQLEEGYRAAAKESIVMAREFEASDLEGWDEY
jgi:hypothetical protein